MGLRRKFIGRTAMASRWRRRRICVLITDSPSPAALREISAAGAFIETRVRPALGSAVELHHPDAGAIAARVLSQADDGIALAFDCGEHSVAFALAAIAADMSRPAAANN